jgi:manganese oxidase
MSSRMPVTGATRLWMAVSAALALFLSLTVAMAFAARNGAQPVTVGLAQQPSAASGPVEIALEVSEFALTPAELTAPADTPLVFTIANVGGLPHDFAIDGVAVSEEIAGGSSATLAVDGLAAGTYDLLCTLVGHADAGMRGTLVVGGDAAAHGHTTTSAPLTPEEMVAGHEEGIAAFPAATEGRGGQPLEPTVDADGTKVFELTADEISWEVEPGVFKDGMAFNGQIPGPRIDVNVGDRVRMIVHNELEVPTGVHMHGQVLPVEMDGVPGLTQPAIMPGESFTYEWDIVNAGSHMYHSHFDSANQVPGGLLGALIVHDGTEEDVDLDYVMVLNDGPLGFTLNGKGFPATEPIVVTQGQKVRIRYMNEGLQIHPMHLHGIPQLVVAKDGYPLPQPYMADNVLVSPGDRVDVIVDATELGTWAFHCHILNHAEGPHGMFGMVTAFIVQPAA